MARASESSASDYKVIVAIDFGTKYSGYAYQVSGSNDIRVFTNWKRSGGYTNYKTPTVALLERSGELMSFGTAAISKHDRLTPPEQKKHLYFTNFKMSLYEQLQEGEQLDVHFELTAASGLKLEALTVFSQSLRFMKQHFMRNFKMMELMDDDIKWVITVPAIWLDAAKHFMRIAAHRAGLINDADSEKLVIALEPEAAGLLCRDIETADYQNSEGTLALPSAGDSYVVIDIGGGTVDIAALEVVDEGRLRQLHYAVGGAHGGGAVDEAFLKTLHDIFDEEVIVLFNRCYPAAYHQLLNNFESEKRNFDAEESLRVNFPNAFFDFLDKRTIDEHINRYNRRTGNDVSMQDGCLDLPVPLVMEFYEPVIDDIVRCTRQVYTEVESLTRIKVIFLVGGFADCSLLEQRLDNEFPSARVLKPREPGLAVVKGAVMFGRNPAVVTERRVSRSYGTQETEIYDERKHGNREELERKGLLYKWKGKLYRHNVYLKIVEKGDVVKLDEVKECKFVWVDADQDRCVLRILSSSSIDTYYIDDPRCTLLGTIELTRQNYDSEYFRGTLKLQFGGTEIKASIVERGCTNEVTKPINYFKKSRFIGVQTINQIINQIISLIK